MIEIKHRPDGNALLNEIAGAAAEQSKGRVDRGAKAEDALRAQRFVGANQLCSQLPSLAGQINAAQINAQLQYGGQHHAQRYIGIDPAKKGGDQTFAILPGDLQQVVLAATTGYRNEIARLQSRITQLEAENATLRTMQESASLSVAGSLLAPRVAHMLGTQEVVTLCVAQLPPYPAVEATPPEQPETDRIWDTVCMTAQS